MKSIVKIFLVATVLLLSAFGSNYAESASRAEIAGINVATADDFQYWNDDSPTKAKIVKFVTEATDINSKNYIPPEDRIATFDMDGTFYCETAPYYFQETMFLHRALDDPNYQPSKEVRDFAKKVKPKIMNKTGMTSEEITFLVSQLVDAYKGMTPEEYRAYVRKFMDTDENGLTHLKRGEAFYLPMVEIMSYLDNNGFAVYIDSACGIDTTRELVKDVIPVRFDRILGSEFVYASTGTGKDTPNKHFYDRFKEKVVIAGPLRENAMTAKIFSIYQQIGKKPVLAFGNTMGDSGMFEFALQDNKYNSMAFCVLCDDLERELGNMKKAEVMKKTAIERGWNTISMRDEFKTIYGDKVRRKK